MWEPVFEEPTNVAGHLLYQWLGIWIRRWEIFHLITRFWITFFMQKRFVSGKYYFNDRGENFDGFFSWITREITLKKGASDFNLIWLQAFISMAHITCKTVCFCLYSTAAQITFKCKILDRDNKLDMFVLTYSHRIPLVWWISRVASSRAALIALMVNYWCRLE